MSSVVLTREQLNVVANRISEYDEFVFDVETVGEHRGDPRRNEVRWLSLAVPGAAWAIPMGHDRGRLLSPERKEKEAWYDDSQPTKSGRGRKKWRTVTIPAEYAPAPTPQLWPSQVFHTLRPLFFSDRVKVGHNVKFDLLSIAKYYDGVPPPAPYGDTLIAAWMLDCRKTTSRDLGALVRREFKFAYDKKTGKQVEIHPFREAARYSFLDAKYTLLLWRRFKEQLLKKRLDNVARLEWDVLEVLIQDTERVGALIDVESAETLKEEIEDRLTGVKARIWNVKPNLNMNSPKQVSGFLYGKKKNGGLGLRPTLYTCGCRPGEEQRCRGDKAKNHAGQASTNKEALAAYAKIPFVADLLEFAEWDKILGTYLNPWLHFNLDGRIFTNLKQHGTETGRFSSAEPNLQNVPRRGDKSKLIRSLFIAPPGRRLIVADYSQIELRVLAHYSRDKRLMGAFIEERDPHRETAAMIFGVAPEDVEDWQRDVAKTINFGIAYGAGRNKVAATAKVSLKRASQMLDTHRRTYPRIYAWKDYVLDNARRDKGVRTLLGRYRPLPNIRSKMDDLRSYDERRAVNTMIQGTSADIIKIAMVRLYRSLPEDAHLILSIHDELIVEAPEETAESVVPIMQDAMEGAFRLRVPLVAEAHVGDQWDEAKAA